MCEVCISERHTVWAPLRAVVPHVCTGVRAQKGPTLGLTLCCHHIEFLNNVDQGVLRFRSALTPSNSVAAPETSKC